MVALAEPDYPRVTAVLTSTGLTQDYSWINPETLALASKRGSTIHEQIDVEFNGGRPRIPSHWTGYWRAYQRFMVETGHQPITSEQVVYHPLWRFKGHLDRTGWHGTRRVLVDWKCVASLDEPAVSVQLAAYRLGFQHLYPDQPIHTCIAVQLRPDGHYRIFEAEVEKFEPIWKAALTLYHWRVKYARVAPRIL